MNETTLAEIFPLTGTGIFSDLQNYDVPWKDKNINADLDIAYIGNHSGDKVISPFIEKLLSDDGFLSTDARAKIASAIYTVCGQNWIKLYNTLNQEYNLLDNTDAYITETTTSEGNKDTTDTIKSTGTDETDHTGTIENKGSSSTNTNNNSGAYGFNSADAVNTDTATGTEGTTADNTETINNKDTETKNLQDDHTGNEKTTGTVTHEQHRHGNIGVTTSQQMLEQERNLWRWYFYDYVFADIDRFLTIKVY